MNAWMGSLVRKVIFAVAGGWIAGLVSSGALEQGQADAWIEATVAVLAALAVAAWTKFILPWLQSKFGKDTPIA